MNKPTQFSSIKYNISFKKNEHDINLIYVFKKKFWFMKYFYRHNLFWKIKYKTFKQ